MFPCSPLFEAVLQPFKRAQLGLFHGKTKQYGNNVPFSKHKTRRSWLPNIQRKRFPSETLGEDIRVKVTTRALKTIKKHGGIDKYIMKTKSDLLAWEGMRLRVLLRNKIKETKAEEREEHGAATARKEPEWKVHNRVRSFHATLLKPTLAGARQQRELVARELKLDGRKLASGHQTVMYLRKTQLAGLTAIKPRTPI